MLRLLLLLCLLPVTATAQVGGAPSFAALLAGKATRANQIFKIGSQAQLIPEADFGLCAIGSAQCAQDNDCAGGTTGPCIPQYGIVRASSFVSSLIHGASPDQLNIFLQTFDKTSGPSIAGNCPEFDSNGSLKDSGIPCDPLTSGAPNNAKYILQTVNGGLSAAQSLGALAGTGLLLNTITATTGILSRYAGVDAGPNTCIRALNQSGAITQTIDVTRDTNNGYAGLDGSAKLTPSVTQEIIGLVDLTDVSGVQGTSGKVLEYAGSAPTNNDCAKFDAAGNVSDAGFQCGRVATLNGLNGSSLSIATDGNGTDVGVTPSGSTITVNLPSASATARGLVTTTAQTIKGAKSFTDPVTIADQNPNANFQQWLGNASTTVVATDCATNGATKALTLINENKTDTDTSRNWRFCNGVNNGPVLPIANDTLVAKATVDTFTNKTFDAEGTGNLFTHPEIVAFPAAGCIGAVPGSMWDLMPTNAPTPQCVQGTNTQKGLLDWPDIDGSIQAQQSYLLPVDLDSTKVLDARIVWRINAGSGNVKWFLDLACVAIDGSATNDDPAFGGNQATVTTTAPAAGRPIVSPITNMSLAGCAGKMLHMKISRDRADGADTLSGGFPRFDTMEVKFRRGE